MSIAIKILLMIKFIIEYQLVNYFVMFEDKLSRNVLSKKEFHFETKPRQIEELIYFYPKNWFFEKFISSLDPMYLYSADRERPISLPPR